MKILFITDAWKPQVNGVVRTLQTVGDELSKLGHDVSYIGPENFNTIPLPTYSEIKLAVVNYRSFLKMIGDYEPEVIHIPTEGPLGWAGRAFCIKQGYQFTTSYHTRFPEYVAERLPIPVSWTYEMLRRFHEPSSAVMVATDSIDRSLQERGFKNLRRWSRGVDTDLFKPRDATERPAELAGMDGPILLYVGRVAVEKNIQAFLDMPGDGTKVVVGDGPLLGKFRKQYPQVHFMGARHGEDLARFFAAADVFIFPSLTDTFGLVILEALASGVPVVAYPAPGPRDILTGHDDVGVITDDLQKGVAQALTLNRDKCRPFAMQYSWAASAQQFLSNLHPFR